MINGVILESYKHENQRKIAVNEADKDGRTPLHIACRSGRLESVILLLEAGADVTLRDKKRETPLHACAYFKRQFQWPDISRPDDSRWHKVFDDNETLRVTEIIHLLLANGANPVAEDLSQRTPLDLAVIMENAEMTVALADTFPNTPQQPRPSAAQLYLMARDDSIDLLVDKLLNTPLVGTRRDIDQLFLTARNDNGDSLRNKLKKIPLNWTTRDFEQLLKLGGYSALERLNARGAKMTQESGSNVHYSDDPSRDFLISVARWGFTDLFGKIGRMRQNHDSDWINGNLHQGIMPFICTVASRALPSMELLRMIVETFNADVNVRTYQNKPSSGEHSKDTPDCSVLHILAGGEHWWQTEAIRYLLQHGADVAMRDAEGRTPLHIAVTGGYRRLAIARVLLEHGADPNALDRKGVTPLGFAAGSPEMVRLLLQHGGKIELGSKPVLFEAIKVQAIDTIRVVIERGFDIREPFKHSLAELDTYEKGKIIPLRGSSPEEAKRVEERRQDELRLLLCRPLHYAARARFNNAPERHKAVAIVELFLSHGADPWHSYSNETTIIHDVLHQGGIVEPLLALPHLDLERRDGRGRTLLMAACEVSKRDSSIFGWAFDNLEPHPTASMQKRYAVDRLCEMGANILASDETGNNVAHLLVATEQVSANEVLPVLIAKCPALVHQKNQQNETPLHIAAKDRKWDLVRTLLDSGGDPLTPDSKGNTILHHLARCLREQQYVTSLHSESRGQLQDINNRVRKGFPRLLDQGAGINTRNDNSETPMLVNVSDLAGMQSLSSAKPGTVSPDFLARCIRIQQFVNSLNPALREPTLDIKIWKETTIWKDFSRLLDQGVDINTRNDNGETSIFEYVRGLACTQSLRSPITDTLVAAGADLLVRNHEGESLLHIVAKLPCTSSYRQCQGKEMFIDSFTYLMEMGLDPFQEDTKQRTPVVCSIIEISYVKTLTVRVGRCSCVWERRHFGIVQKIAFIYDTTVLLVL